MLQRFGANNKVGQHSSQDSPHFLHELQVWMSPEISFSNSVEEFIEFNESCYTHGYNLLQRKDTV